jgi:hypothetical protein
MPPITEGLFVELSLITKEWSQGIKTAQAEAKELEKSFKPLKQAALDIGAPMAAAGTAVVGALVLMTKQAANYADAIRDAAIRTNTTTQEMSAFKYLAEQSGTSVDVLQKGLTILAKNAFSNSAAFKQLGVDTKDSNGNLKSSKDLFGEVSDKLSLMKDGTQKTGIELALFGKNATQMQEVLNGGKAAIDAAAAATERFGTAIGPEAAAAADKFNDTLNDMAQAQLGLSQAISNALLPFLTDVATRITNLIVIVQQWTNAHPELVRNILLLGGALAGAGGLLIAIAGVSAALPVLATAFTLLTGPIGLTVAAIGALGAAFAYFPKFREVVLIVIKDIVEAVVGLGSIIGSLGQALYQLATGQFKTAFETIKNSGTKALDAATGAADKFDVGITEVGDSLKSLKAGFDHIKEPIRGTSDDLDKAATKAKAVFSAADALTIKFGEMRGVTMRVSDELRTQQKTLDSLDSALASAANSSRQLAAAEREWNDTIATLNASLKQLPINARAAQNDLLMIKPPAIDLGPTKEQLDASHQRYEELFSSVKDTAKHAFLQMFEDGKFHFSALADVAKGIFETLWTEVLSSLTAQLLTPLVGKITGMLSGALSKIPGLGGLLGGGASAAGSVGGGAGSVGGSIGSIGGSLTGGLITGGLAAVGGILGGILGNDKGAQKETAFNTGATYTVLKDSVSGKLQDILNLVNYISEAPIFYGLLNEIGYWSGETINAIWQASTAAAEAISGAVSGLGASISSAIAFAASSASAASSQGNLALALPSGQLPLPQYEMGTAAVPRTGLAIVHKDEMIVSSHDKNRIVALLEALLQKEGGDLLIDGEKVTRIVNGHQNRLARAGGGGIQVIATEVRR